MDGTQSETQVNDSVSAEVITDAEAPETAETEDTVEGQE